MIAESGPVPVCCAGPHWISKRPFVNLRCTLDTCISPIWGDRSREGILPSWFSGPARVVQMVTPRASFSRQHVVCCQVVRHDGDLGFLRFVDAVFSSQSKATYFSTETGLCFPKSCCFCSDCCSRADVVIALSCGASLAVLILSARQGRGWPGSVGCSARSIVANRL